MILNIFGGGGSGKTTLQFALLEQTGFVNLVPFTTRARRSREQDGVHYHFVTPEVFEQSNLVMKRFANNSMYGVALQDITMTGIVITTLDLNGIAELERLKVDARVVFLNISEAVRIERMLGRGDDPTTVMSRIKMDREHICYPKTIYPVLEIREENFRQNFDQVLNFVK